MEIVEVFCEELDVAVLDLLRQFKDNAFGKTKLDLRLPVRADVEFEHSARLAVVAAVVLGSSGDGFILHELLHDALTFEFDHPFP